MNKIYKNYIISYNPKPIGTTSHDWDFAVDGYDGADDSKDIRAGTGSSVEDCISQIDEIIEELQ